MFYFRPSNRASSSCQFRRDVRRNADILVGRLRGFPASRREAGMPRYLPVGRPALRKGPTSRSCTAHQTDLLPALLHPGHSAIGSDMTVDKNRFFTVSSGTGGGQIRNQKAEIRKKPEGRSPKERLHQTVFQACRSPWRLAANPPNHRSGASGPARTSASFWPGRQSVRALDFGFLSAFGFRSSDFNPPPFHRL